MNNLRKNLNIVNLSLSITSLFLLISFAALNALLLRSYMPLFILLYFLFFQVFYVALSMLGRYHLKRKYKNIPKYLVMITGVIFVNLLLVFIIPGFYHLIYFQYVLPYLALLSFFECLLIALCGDFEKAKK